MEFISPEVALYPYKSILKLLLGVPSCYLDLLKKLQKWICRTVVRSLAASLEPLAHRRNVDSLNQLVPLPSSRGGALVILTDWMIG